MKTMIFSSVLLFSLFSLAETLEVKGMSCGACVKQVTSTVCKDSEMSTWFESCSAKIKDSPNEIGQIEYKLKGDVKLDEAKISQIEKTLEKTGRSLIKK